MRILVTNDDGIDSQGLHILAHAMRSLGEVVVVAPNEEYSGAGAALGPLQLIKPEVRRVTVEGLTEAWSVTGPPALCVMFAHLGAFGPSFDLVVSGINPGVNVGRSVYHSGTVGAALTARTRGMNAVAVSQAVKEFGVEGQGGEALLADQCWHSAAAVAEAVVAGLVADPPSPPVVVNLNVPNLPLERITTWRHTTVGTTPPRAMAGAVLEAKPGHPGAFRVRMSWGDTVPLPIETDGGAIEHDEVSLTFLGPISGEDPPCAPTAASALDRLLGR